MSFSSPPPLKFGAIGVELNAPLGGSSEGRVTFLCFGVVCFELAGIVFHVAALGPILNCLSYTAPRSC